MVAERGFYDSVRFSNISDTSPSIELTSAYDGCNCCLAPSSEEDFMIPDGER